MRQLNPGCKVRYTTGEAFTNAFVKAIRTRTVDAFQKKYRNLDLLCVDDIHLIAGKQATQHELLQIFNMLSLGGARIILASDAHPRTIARFDQSLSSRFSAGLVVRVDEPDEALALRLVHAVAHKRGMMVDDACARVVCDRIGIGRGASVRDIEGALVQIQAVAQLLDRDHGNGGMISPTAGHIRKALSLRCGDEDTLSRAPLSLDSIIRNVCDELSVSIGDLKGKGRRKKVVLARELIVHLARQLTSKSFPEIAHAIGRPNHSTVITAAKRYKDRLAAQSRVDADCPLDGLPLSELTQRLTRSVQRA
jgi:chromosomal replication initiator protein